MYMWLYINIGVYFIFLCQTITTELFFRRREHSNYGIDATSNSIIKQQSHWFILIPSLACFKDVLK